MKSVVDLDFRIRAALIIATATLLCFASRNFHVDDGLIYARCISHALHGRGLQFNDGESVNALTSILDTCLLLPLSWLLHKNVLLAQLILAGVFLAGSALLAEYVVPLAGIFITVCPFLYFFSGMETTLFLFLLILCATSYVKGRINWLPFLCGLCVLARFEGGAMAAVIAWQLWKTKRFPRVWAWLPVLPLAALYFYFNFHFYHQPFPHSATAKFGQGLSGAWGRWPTAFLKFPDVAGTWIYVPAAGVLAWLGKKDYRMATLNTVVWPFLIILCGFYVVFNIPSYPWYYAPMIFFLIVYAVRLVPSTAQAYMAAYVIAVALAAATGAYLYRAESSNQDYIHAAVWLQHNSPQTASIAAAEIGNIGWYCDRPIDDIVGLTSPRNAEYTAHKDFSSWLTERPDYIVVHPDTPFRWDKVALASADYEFVPVHFGSVSILKRK